MSALFRLEDAGVEVVTSLADVHQQLAEATKVSLDEIAQTEYNQSNPMECVELVIRKWTSGESLTLPPTWRSLYAVLADLCLGAWPWGT